MEQLFQYYQTPQDFQQILNEVYSHQEAARILSELPEYQEETLEKAKQLLNQDFYLRRIRNEDFKDRDCCFGKWRQKVLTFIQAIS